MPDLQICFNSQLFQESQLFQGVLVALVVVFITCSFYHHEHGLCSMFHYAGIMLNTPLCWHYARYSIMLALCSVLHYAGIMLNMLLALCMMLPNTPPIDVCIQKYASRIYSCNFSEQGSLLEQIVL